MIACFMGIVSSVMGMAVPENGMKKHLMSILGLIALLAVLSPFAEDGFRLTLKDIDLETDIDISADDAKNEMSEIFLADARSQYDEYFTELLNKNNIRTAKVDTALYISGEYELEIEYIEVELYDITMAETTRELIEREIPGSEIRIWQVEDEGMDFEAAE